MKDHDPVPASTRCPSDESFRRAFQGEGTLEEKDALITHIQTCARCRLKFDVLLQVRTDVQDGKRLRPSAPPIWKLVLVCPAVMSALVIILLGGAFFLLRQEQDRAHRGGAESLVLIEPAGKLPEPPGVFAWTSVKKADCYIFELVDDELTRITSTHTHRPRLVLPAADKAKLKRGRTYVWSVSAFDDLSRFLDSASRSFEIE